MEQKESFTGEVGKRHMQDVYAEICPNVYKLFTTILPDELPGNFERRELLRRCLGDSLFVEHYERSNFVCWGKSGGNGKSGIMRRMKTVLGDFGVEGGNNQWAKGKRGLGNEHASHKMKLEGKRFLLVEEADCKKLTMDESVWKTSADGGSVIGRGLRESEREFENTCKMWINTNPEMKMPSDNAWAILQRLIVFKLCSKFFDDNMPSM